MPKRLLKRFLPDHRTIREHQQLKRFGKLLHDPNLWHLNRRSAPGAVAVGLFVAFLPVPFQMVIAAAIAIICRINLPIAVVLVWITNPLTMPAIFYFSYKVGARLLGERIHPIEFEASLHWLMTEAHMVWTPLLLGSMICGTVSGIIGYLTVRSLWRLQVLKSWQARKLRLHKAADSGEKSGRKT